MANDPKLKVGYGKPPIGTRFKKGVSGNPKGRPKNQESSLLSLFAAELSVRQTATINGRKVRMTNRELLAKKWTQLALQGDYKAMQLLLSCGPTLDQTPKHLNLLSDAELRKMSTTELTQKLHEVLKRGN